MTLLQIHNICKKYPTRYLIVQTTNEEENLPSHLKYSLSTQIIYKKYLMKYLDHLKVQITNEEENLFSHLRTLLQIQIKFKKYLMLKVFMNPKERKGRESLK